MVKQLWFLLIGVLPFSATAQAPPQAAGYNLVFSDTFTSLNLSPTGAGSYDWYPGIWWDPKIPLPTAISTADSVLDLMWARAGGMATTNISTFARDASQGHTFRYGYFEARMKWDVVNGAWPSFWMLPKQVAEGAQNSGEIDIFEGEGTDPRQFNGTLHEWRGRTEVWANKPNWYTLPANNDFSQWHTYGVLWVPGQVTWYYDDQPLFSSSTTSIFDSQDFFLVLGMTEGSNWNEGDLTGVTASSIHLNVDWVHVWQNGPAATPLSGPTATPTPTTPTPTTPAPATPAPTAPKPVTPKPIHRRHG